MILVQKSNRVMLAFMLEISDSNLLQSSNVHGWMPNTPRTKVGLQSSLKEVSSKVNTLNSRVRLCNMKKWTGE